MTRGVQIAVTGVFFIFAAGCHEPERPPDWGDVKIGDLAEPKGLDRPANQKLRTANFDVHIFELPAGNAPKLQDLWESLYTRNLRFYNYRAFDENLFRAGFARQFGLSGTEALLKAAGGKRLAKVSMLLPDGQPQDITIIPLDRPQELAYLDRTLSRQKLIVGPGVLSLRLIAQRLPGERGVCRLVAYPAFSSPPSLPITGPPGRANQPQLEFKAAGFGLKMSPGDFVVLGPRKYLSETVTLPGLFFSNLKGTTFLSKGEPPRRKISIRVFVLVCNAINYRD